MIVAATAGSKAGHARKRSRKDEDVVPISSVFQFLDMAADALRAKSIANDLLQTEVEVTRQQLEQQKADHDAEVDSENAQAIEDSGFLKQQLEALLQERAGFRESVARLERENQFLLEERDLLSQQLASESSVTPLRPSEAGSLTPLRPPHRALSPIPYAMHATPSAAGTSAAGDPLSGGWLGFRTDGDSLAGTVDTPAFSGGRGASPSPEPPRTDGGSALPEQRRAALLAELRARYASGGGASGVTPAAHRPPPRSSSSPAGSHVRQGDTPSWHDAASPGGSLQWGASTPFFTPAPGSAAQPGSRQLARLSAVDVPGLAGSPDSIQAPDVELTAISLTPTQRPRSSSGNE